MFVICIVVAACVRIACVARGRGAMRIMWVLRTAALLCVEVHCELAGWRRSVDLCINLTLVVRPTTT